VADLNPDIVNFCEIEGCDELNAVMDNLDGYGYEPYLIYGDDSSTGQDVGFLSRIGFAISIVNFYYLSLIDIM